MEKCSFSGVRDSKVGCSTRVAASGEQDETDSDRRKFTSNVPAQVFQRPNYRSADTSSSWGVLGGMAAHNIQPDQPPNLLLKGKTFNGCNVSSLRRDFSIRSGETRSFVRQAGDYKQEFREHQIQQWVSRHSSTQESIPRDHWLGPYPQLKEGTSGSENLGSGKAHEGGHGLDTHNAFVKRISTDHQTLGSNKAHETGQGLETYHFTKKQDLSHPNEAHMESQKKQVRFYSKDAIITESGSIEASEGVPIKRMKLSETCQELANETVAPEAVNAAAGSPFNSGDVGRIEITLREWLSRPGRVVDCCESLNIFKQILQFVDLAHGQGVMLKNVRPSSFLLSSLHRVSFLDSASSSSSSGSSEPSIGAASVQASVLADTATMRGEDVSQSVEGSSSTACIPQHVRDSHDVYFQASGSSEDPNGFPNDRSNFLEWKAVKSRKRGHSIDSSDSLSNDKNPVETCFPLRPTRLMEDAWYTSPEEVQDGTCSFVSDVYSLGVLFFELFCPFRSWEEHSRLMIDLRHRILPPHFLSDRPKEAAFCLWLLHPDPNSRPKTRDILQSEILNDAGEALAERQDAMNIEEREAEAELLLDFLLRMQTQKQALAKKLEDEISCLTSDILEVKKRQSYLHQSSLPLDNQDPSSKITEEVASAGQWNSQSKLLKVSNQSPTDEIVVDSTENQMCGGLDAKRRQEQIRSKSSRMMSNFDKFEEAYFAMRWKVQPQVLGAQSTLEGSTGSVRLGVQNAGFNANKGIEVGTDKIKEKDSLGCFFDSICKYARYSRFEVKATLLHGNLLNTSNMVCSLSFDRDQEYFATAGICKRVRVFDCDAVLSENVDIHYPVVEMTANSKLSSICWNSYIKSHIASSDYDGVVQLWDASTAQSLRQYKEHKKRAWSVDFSTVDPTRLASGSDDCTVKLWSINQEGSTATIKTEANVCCVQFPVDSAHLIAFGSANYKIYCYDLRNIRMPWCILANHQKAVSYVKFLDSDTLVSASTDNTLKLWDISRTNFSGGVCRTPTLTYTGHTNEKNFVGLSVMDGYIACGSETNAVVAYHKSLPMPIATHKFGCMDPISGKNMGDDAGKFVSSVCWRPKSQMLVAANSMGNIKVLEMV